MAQHQSSDVISDEKLCFDIYFNYGLINTKVGEFEINKIFTEIDGKDCYKLNSSAQTSENWKWLYKLKINQESICKPDKFEPSLFKEKIYEGRNFYEYEYHFNNEIIEAYSSENGKTKNNSIKFSSGNIRDALSAIYYLRNLEFDHLKKNDSIVLHIYYNNTLLTQTVKYLGITILETSNSQQECYLFSSYIHNNKIISNKEPALVWVSTKNDHEPLLIKVELLVGSVDVILNGN